MVQQNTIDGRSLFERALQAAMPAGRFVDLPAPPAGKVIVVGAGKAAASMAAAFEDAWIQAYPDVPVAGLVVTRYDHGQPCHHIKVVEAAHPVPDSVGRQAATEILSRVSAATADDLVVCLISGGASALLTLPAMGIDFETKQQINRALLKSGMAIGDMNTVRKALSAVKGGRLAAAAEPARVVTYLISDVPGDAPETIGSGPSVASTPGSASAIDLLDRAGINVTQEIRQAILSNPVPRRLAKSAAILIATPQMALEAAAGAVSEANMTALILGDSIEGEARSVGQVMAGIARQVIHNNQPARRPAVLLSGGETTVTVTGDGRGGRNAEFLLSLVIAMNGSHGKWQAIAADTDGIDGVEDNAGVTASQSTLAEAAARGLDPQQYLDNNDAYSFFAALDALVITGPTRTNVNDFRAIIIP